LNKPIIKFYDTNAMLALKEKPFLDKSISFTAYGGTRVCNFALSHKTLEEIENIKTSSKKDEEVKYAARKVSHALQDYDNYFVCNSQYDQILSEIMAKGLEATPDAVIITECYLFSNDYPEYDIIFVTDDVCCYNIAKRIFNLKVETLRSLSQDLYKGYVKIQGNTTETNEKFAKLVENNELFANEYVIFEDENGNSVKECRWDGEKLCDLRLPPNKVIKARNSLQRCALDALNNKELSIVCVFGKVGSGKSILTLLSGLYQVRDKGNQSTLLGVREPRGEGAQVGYLPGEFEDKTGDFFTPLAQQLQGGQREFDSLKMQGILDVQIPYYLKGTTYNDYIILVDEAEDLTESQIKLIGTRLGSNSRIFFSGDYKQSLINRTVSNPLVKMCEAFKGNSNFACIYLEDDVRSTASKQFAELYE